MGQADRPTLKSLSLVSRDFCAETARELCGNLSFVVAPALDDGTRKQREIEGIRARTAALRNHSRKRFVKRIHISLGARLGDAQNPEVSTTIRELLEVVQFVQMEELEIDMLCHQAEIAPFLRASQFSPSLHRLRLQSYGPLISLEGFWEHHPSIRDLCLIGVPVGLEENLSMFLANLESLHVRSIECIRHLYSPPPSLRSLTIQQLRINDLSTFHELGDNLKPLLSQIETFNFSFPVGNSPLVYEDIVSKMKGLRHLVARHGMFRNGEDFVIAVRVLQALPALEVFEWVGDGMLNLDAEKCIEIAAHLAVCPTFSTYICRQESRGGRKGLQSEGYIIRRRPFDCLWTVEDYA